MSCKFIQGLIGLAMLSGAVVFSQDLGYSCPSQQFEDCKCESTISHLIVFKCSSEGSLQYTVNYDANSDQIEMECMARVIPYKPAMFGNFNLNSQQVKSVHFISCPLPGISFKDLLGDLQPPTLTATIFGKESLNASLFANLTYVTRLTISSGNVDSLDEMSFRDMPQLEYLDLSLNLLQTIPSEIFNQTTNLRELNLNGNQFNTFPNLTVPLPKLESISISNSQIITLLPNSFDFSPNLKVLSLSNNQLRTLPATVFHNFTQLESLDLSINELTTIPAELFKSCKNLMTFTIHLNLNLTYLSPDVFSEMTSLQNLDLRKINLNNVPANLLVNLTKLIHLDLSHNSIDKIPPKFFNNNNKLEFIDMSFNRLSILPSKLLKQLFNLRILRVTNNQLKSIGQNVISDLPSLIELDVNSNNITTIDSRAFEGTNNITFFDISHNVLTFFQESPFPLPISTRHLNASFNNISVFPLPWTSAISLSGINLTNNFIQSVNTYDLLFRSKEVVVDLTNNRIEIINLEDVDQFPTPATGNPGFVLPVSSVPLILIDDNPINCDCNVLEFIRYIKVRNFENNIPFRFSATKLKCVTPAGSMVKDQIVTAVNEDYLYCNVDDNCDGNCECRKTAVSSVVSVNCTGQSFTNIVQKVPYNTSKLFLDDNRIKSISHLKDPVWANLTEVHLSGNDIENIDTEISLPKKLRFLSLDRNKMTRMPQWLMDVVADRMELNLNLGNNSWQCDCTAVKFYQWLTTTGSRKVLDISAVTCASGMTGEKLITLTASSLCPHDSASPASAILVGFFTTLILLAIVIFIGYCVVRNRFQLKLWLFRRRLCLCLRTDDDIEAGHPL